MREPLNKFLGRACIPSGAKQAAEKPRRWCEHPGIRPSGPKGSTDFAGFMYGLKPVPFTENEFFAAYKARTLHRDEFFRSQ
jgi:hypothetical protein